MTTECVAWKQVTKAPGKLSCYDVQIFFDMDEGSLKPAIPTVVSTAIPTFVSTAIPSVNEILLHAQYRKERIFKIGENINKYRVYLSNHIVYTPCV